MKNPSKGTTLSLRQTTNIPTTTARKQAQQDTSPAQTRIELRQHLLRSVQKYGAERSTTATEGRFLPENKL